MILNVEGERFAVNLDYSQTPLRERLMHASYKEILTPDSIAANRFIPSSEHSLILIPVNQHEVQGLEVNDKHGDKTVDVLGILPAGWRLRSVTFTLEMERIMKALGQDLYATGEIERTARRLPMLVMPDKNLVTLPVYRLKRMYPEYVDEAAEHIIYNVGTVIALSRGVRDQIGVFEASKQYLRDTFGGYLLMDTVP